MNRLWPLLGAISFLICSCTPLVLVKPGQGKEPTVLRVRAKAKKVLLYGTMTDWRPLALIQQAGRFEISLSLPTGRYEYRLEMHDSAGIHPIFPEAGEKVDDGFGGENIVLRIR